MNSTNLNNISYGRKRTELNNNKTDNKKGESEKNSLAARVVMIFGAVVLLFFFVFASFGRNAEPIEYSENNTFDGESVISVFSQLVYSDGRTVDNSEGTNTDESVQSDNNVTADASESEWNLWQYLCDSLAELFGVTYR